MSGFDKNTVKFNSVAHALMLQGTGSDVGKSLIAAGLCRAFSRRGLRVRPFKPQNMTNNAAITTDGGEIGGAQALQARACGVSPTSDMNPVLLKPESDRGSQVIVQGKSRGVMPARDYMTFRSTLMPDVLESFERLRAESDLVIIEGAGSISEVNLRDGDIANMGFATAAGVPVVLAADIDRGGAIASIVGSHALLPSEERALLKGYIINKFRGDISLFAPAVDIIRNYTSLPSFGVLPWFDSAAKLPQEDSLALAGVCAQSRDKDPRAQRKIKICVLRFRRISNFDEFDPLAMDERVEFSFVAPGNPLPGDADLVILPGTKSVLDDLMFLRSEGWDIDVAAHVRRGGHVLGICGGYLMLGRTIKDSDITLPFGQTDGLSLLDVETLFKEGDAVRPISAVTEMGFSVNGYEVLLGEMSGQDTQRPMLRLDGLPAGAKSRCGRVYGCCVHGLFANDAYRSHFLSSFADGGSSFEYAASLDSLLDELASHAEKYLDIPALAQTAGIRI